MGVQDASKPFPSSRVAFLRWSLKTQDESFLPLNITCWPEEEGGGKVRVCGAFCGLADEDQRCGFCCCNR